jgi:inosine-uridine nucleoside N-ribohydrolase
VHEEIGKLGCAAHMYQCDLSDRDKVLKIIPLISDHGDEINILYTAPVYNIAVLQRISPIRIGTRL